MNKKSWHELNDVEKEKQRERNRRHYHRYPEKMNARRVKSQLSNRTYIDTFKTSCSRCGFRDKRALQFHHVSGEKDKNVSQLALAGYSKKRILAEIERCIVLCANCHQMEHIENGYKTDHKRIRH